MTQQDYFGNNVSPDGVSAPPGSGGNYTSIDPATPGASSFSPPPAQTPPPAPPAPPAPSYTDTFLGGGSSIKPPLPTTLPSSNPGGVDPNMSSASVSPTPNPYGEAPSVPPPPQGQAATPQPMASPLGSEQTVVPPSNQYGVPPVAQAPTPSPHNTTGWAQQNSPAAQQIKSKSGLYLFGIIFLLIVGAGAIYFFFLLPAEQSMVKTPVIKVNDSGASTVSVAESRDSARKKDLANIQTALEQYYIKNGLYPLSPDTSPTQDSATPLAALVPDFLPALPVDPDAPEVYYGYKSADGKEYTLTAFFDTEPANIQSTKTESGSFEVVLSAGVNITAN